MTEFITWILYQLHLPLPLTIRGIKSRRQYWKRRQEAIGFAIPLIHALHRKDKGCLHCTHAVPSISSSRLPGKDLLPTLVLTSSVQFALRVISLSSSGTQVGTDSWWKIRNSWCYNTAHHLRDGWHYTLKYNTICLCQCQFIFYKE